MQLSIGVIDNFRDMSHVIASVLSHVQISQNAFVWSHILLKPPYEITETELICKFDDAVIAFSGIHPSKILALTVDAPIPFNEEIKSTKLKTWNNAGSTPIHDTHKVTEEETITRQKNVADELLAEVSAKVGFAYAGFSAEVSAHVANKLSISETDISQKRVVDEETMDIDVPAWSSVSLKQQVKISDIRQVVTMLCELDAGIRINDGTWEKSFESLNSFQLYLQGGGGGKGTATELDAYVNSRKLAMVQLPHEKRQLRVSKEDISHNVVTGEVTRSEIPIEH